MAETQTTQTNRASTGAMKRATNGASGTADKPKRSKGEGIAWTPERVDALILAVRGSNSTEEIVEKLKVARAFESVKERVDKTRVGNQLRELRKAGAEIPKFTARRVLDIARLNRLLRGEEEPETGESQDRAS